MHLIRTALAALVAATLLATPAAAAQDATPDPAAVAAEEARAAAEAALGPRYRVGDDGRGTCVDLPPSDGRIAPTVPPGFVPGAGMNGGPGWQVSSPRVPIRAGETARLGLRDKFGTATRRVGAVIAQPDGTTALIGDVLVRDGWSSTSYPDGFVGGAPTTPGTYTVVWRDTATDGFLACDGFVVAP